MTPEAEAAIRKAHVESPGAPPDRDHVCLECWGTWPCDATDLLTALDAARAENARLRTALESDDWSAAVDVLGQAVADDPPDPDSPMVSNEWTYLLLERLHDAGWSFIARAAPERNLTCRP